MQTVQYYQRTIIRLRADLQMLQSQLAATRARLMVCEQYELKYQLLLQKITLSSRQYQQIQSQQKRNGKQQRTIKSSKEQQQKPVSGENYQQLKANVYTWEQKCIKLQQENSTFEQKLAKAYQTLQQWENKYNKMIMTKINTLQAQQQKKKTINPFEIENSSQDKSSRIIDDRQRYISRQKGKEQLLELKFKSAEKSNQYLKAEIAQERDQFQREKKQLREQMQNNIKMQQNSDKIYYRETITNLQLKIQELQEQCRKERQRASPERQLQNQKLKSQILRITEQSSKEIEGLVRRLEQYKIHMQQLRQERDRVQQIYSKTQRQYREQMKQLHNKIIQKQKEYRMDMMALQQKLQLRKEHQIKIMKEHIKKIQKQSEINKEQWLQKIQTNNSQLVRIKKVWQQNRKRYIQDKNKLKNEILQLKQLLSNREQERDHQSSHNLVDTMKMSKVGQQKQNNYENGIIFLDRQLKRATFKLSQKDREINELIGELNSTRTEHEEEQNYLKLKADGQSGRLRQKIRWLQEELSQIEEKNRKKEKQLTEKENMLQRMKKGLSDENQQLKNIIKQMERDFSRITGHKDQLQGDYRAERDSCIIGNMNVSEERKKKWTELERQRHELQIYYKQRELRLRNNHQIQLRKIDKENQQEKLKNQQLKGQIERLGILMKEQGISVVQDKENLLKQYNNKVNTLDLEISLTQNLYDCIHQTKARVGKRAHFSELSQHQSMSEESERKNKKQSVQNLEKQSSFANESNDQKVSQRFKFCKEQDSQNLLVSFNPKIEQL